MLTREEELKWLAGLKVGDRVSEGDYIARVTKVTATQIACGGIRFNRRTGKLIGSHGFRARWVRPVTPELLDRVLRNELEAKLCHGSIKNVPTATLILAVALLDRARGGHE